MRLVDIIAGARPNFVKVAAIIRALDEYCSRGGKIRYRLVHTGQHYDARMSGEFFEQLGIPTPAVNLEVGAGTHAEQTAAIMTRYEALLLKSRADLCLVVGDVTSTMACAITAQKLCVPVAHVEAGIRSGDKSMPEEINRMVTDAIADWFFTTTELACENLRQSGIDDDRIFFVGNTMIDTLLLNIPRLRRPRFFEQLSLRAGRYFVLTLHRPINVDKRDVFGRLISSIAEGTQGLPVVFPVHPRTAKTLRELGDLPLNIHIVEPQPYLEFNYLVKNAMAVITDSGGVSEETTVMGVPCLTLRNTTERPETVSIGTNELIGDDPSAIRRSLERLFEGKWKRGAIPQKWDGETGRRIVDVLDKLLRID